MLFSLAYIHVREYSEVMGHSSITEHLFCMEKVQVSISRRKMKSWRVASRQCCPHWGPPQMCSSSVGKHIWERWHIRNLTSHLLQSRAFLVVKAALALPSVLPIIYRFPVRIPTALANWVGQECTCPSVIIWLLLVKLQAGVLYWDMCAWRTDREPANSTRC